jgi:voltage-gated sodium channel
MAYGRLGVRVDNVCTHRYFKSFITAAIFAAGIVSGVQTYDVAPGVITVLDRIILAVFSIEVVMKIVAHGLSPLQFFVGPDGAWNVFDLFVTGICLATNLTNLVDGIGISLLRLLRLVRVAHDIPQVRVIMGGLMGGLSSMGYILLLLLLVFYMYGILGVFTFQQNDPFHFGTLPRAIGM